MMRARTFISLCLLALLATSCVASTPAVRSGVWYEIFVRSWYDSNGDGVGDLNGVTAKLDYLKALGVDGIWLMPINPSPSYHGYDVTDYQSINPEYGTLDDFKALLAAAHQRGIRVIMDMVINHTSNQHPWFKSAKAASSPYRGWYIWADQYTDVDTPNAFGGRAWNSTGNDWYLSIFDSGMPDLDFDNPDVRARMIAIGQFWLQQGVDGFRLDAARHLYEDLSSDMAGTRAMQKNIGWWAEYRHGLDAVNPAAYLVGEVSVSDADRLARYLGPLDAVFDFPAATAMINAARSESRQDIAASLQNMYQSFAYAAYAGGGPRAVGQRETAGSGVIQDAPFLSNHDQDRVMSQLDGSDRHMRMAAAMLLTLPGQPFLYYGEELGMRGRKPDPDLRAPMRWQRAPDALGETRWHAVAAENGPAISVEAQSGDANSLLNFYTRLIHWRIDLPVLRNGSFHAYPASSDHLVAWVRGEGDEAVLVVHNLAGAAQSMALNVPDEPAFTNVVEQSGAGASLAGSTLHMQPYSTVVIQ
ncbi:MAG TPA: alpha-amylase family glycosyl hydrolase [Rhodanobacteraceae bacterium]|nr:alpha-amylase family glycosyl hydrolase [Rhodanobacteraceae bacterium]